MNSICTYGILIIDLHNKLSSRIIDRIHSVKNIPISGWCKSCLKRRKRRCDSWKFMTSISNDIKNFQGKHRLEKVIVIYTNSKKHHNIEVSGANNMLENISTNKIRESSILYAVSCACIPDCIFINASENKYILNSAILELSLNRGFVADIKLDNKYIINLLEQCVELSMKKNNCLI